jgi:hypothetical protein
MVFILDSRGPIVIPFTDAKGNPLSSIPDPVDLSEAEQLDVNMSIDRRVVLKTPLEVFDKLPPYLRTAADKV